jgi:hypothetical protein
LPHGKPVHEKETHRPANRIKDGHPKYEFAGLHNRSLLSISTARGFEFSDCTTGRQ